MPEILESSTTVQFKHANNKGTILFEQDDERITKGPEEVYIRLYPGAPDKTIVTAGFLLQSGKGEKEVDEYLLLSLEAEAPLQYPKAIGVNVSLIGSAYSENGDLVNIQLQYNESKHTIVSDTVCYAMLRVTYTAPYQLYLYTFHGEPCGTKLNKGSIEYTGGYTRASVVAINLIDKATDTIELVPEPCGASNNTVIYKDTPIPSLVLEIHKDFNPRITGTQGFTGVEVSCKVRQVPAVLSDISLSSGTFRREEFTGSTVTKDRDTPVGVVSNYNPSSTEQVSDIITFNAGYTGKLRYQPHRSVKVIPTGQFLDRWGNTFSPSFALPGDSIVEVEWVSERVYRNPRRRVVQSDEIVAVSSSGYTTEIYGSVKAEYVIQYQVYDVTFAPFSSDRAEDGWENIHMLALVKSEGSSAYLSIEAPSIKE